MHANAAVMNPTASIRRYTGEYGAHAHHHSQVLVGLNGRLELEVAGRSACVDASSALIVPAGVSHAYLAVKPAAVLVIDAPPMDGLQRIRRFVPPSHWKDEARDLDAMAALGEVVGAATVLQRRTIELEALAAAIDAELHGDWSTPRLAALCALSVQRFHSRFAELTGTTPGAYVRRRRLDEAQRLLRAGFSLDAAALHVGYASASALAFALRRERGVGARVLRRTR
jgi:AraC-like DNA-binding protein/mannose-6-phosphate isomerase-like protein (cupin superfamily)